jgi:hypothetical protein
MYLQCTGSVHHPLPLVTVKKYIKWNTNVIHHVHHVVKDLRITRRQVPHSVDLFVTHHPLYGRKIMKSPAKQTPQSLVTVDKSILVNNLVSSYGASPNQVFKVEHPHGNIPSRTPYHLSYVCHLL